MKEIEGQKKDDNISSFLKAIHSTPNKYLNQFGIEKGYKQY